MMKKTAANKITTAGFIITFIGAILFSTKAVIVKKAFADIKVDALSLLTLRMICALPFYLLALYFNNRRHTNTKLNKKQWLQIILLGLFGYYISSLLDFEGLQYVTAGLERLILFLYPTFVVLINTFFFRQKITVTQKIALFLTYAGIGIAYFGELTIDFSNPDFLWGSVLIFLCSITYSIYIVGSGKLIPYTGAPRFTAYAMLTATAGIFIHFILRNNWHPLQNTNNGLLMYGILLAVVATVIPSFLLSDGMKKIGSSNVAIISSIGPVSTIIQAHFFLGEKFITEQIIGTILVIAGVLLISRKGKEPAV
jgi:drug/metabolite transporter (DMT)-like permease